MCIVVFEKPSNAPESGISLVSVIAAQSPTFVRIASGSAGIWPDRTLAIFLASTKSLPSGSVLVLVTGTGVSIATTLKVRSRRPCGQSPSVRLANGSIPTAGLAASAFSPR